MAGGDDRRRYIYAVFDLPQVNQVYMMFRSRLLDLDFPGRESLEIKLFTKDQIPWNQIVLITIIEMLKLYFKDRHNGRRSKQHGGEIVSRNDNVVRMMFLCRLLRGQEGGVAIANLVFHIHKLSYFLPFASLFNIVANWRSIVLRAPAECCTIKFKHPTYKNYSKCS